MTSTAAPGAERRAARAVRGLLPANASTGAPTSVRAIVVAALVASVLGAGCSAGPGRTGDAGQAASSPKAAKPASAAGDKAAGDKAAAAGKPLPGPLDASFGPVAKDWASFRQSRVAMQRAIDAKAAAMKSGPVGSAAAELASLRLASSSRDLIDSGSLDAARSSLQRAISLDFGDGWAWLWLACVHHAQGRDEQAAETLAKARSRLPRDAGVDPELAGLAAAIRARAKPAPAPAR